jgi:hypothetical protein
MSPRLVSPRRPLSRRARECGGGNYATVGYANSGKCRHRTIHRPYLIDPWGQLNIKAVDLAEWRHHSVMKPPSAFHH